MNFKALLKSKRWNFATMARALGVSHPTVRNWYKARKPITRTSKAHERLVGMHDGRSYKRFAGKRAIKNPSEGKEKEMTQKKIDIVIKDKSNDYHIHFFITRDEAVRY